MRYVSTRGNSLKVSGARAIATGLAPDGGLFTPEEIIKMPDGFLARLCALSYEDRAANIMGLYLDDFTKEELAAIAKSAYGGGKFPEGRPAPLHFLGDNAWALELWHGPTCAFKDMALQMLPLLLTASLKKCGEDRTACILTATSGDTGKAALAGFAGVPGTKILVFYPKDGVSAMQRLQMTTQQGENVAVCGISGNFDDAQRAVKRIFNDKDLIRRADSRGMFFTSANSINWGRLLPQVVYYISAYCDLVADGAVRMGENIHIAVPTGNFGNILAAYFAKKMGLPVALLLCASNANRVLTDFFAEDGHYDAKRRFFATISPSMDILVSSNLERLLYYASGRDDEAVRRMMASLAEHGEYRAPSAAMAAFRRDFFAGSLDDTETKMVIARLFFEKDYLADPHTAVAAGVWEAYRKQTGDDTKTLIASTANPFKFCGSVLSALGEDGFAEDGAALIDRLADKTGRVPPPALAALKTAKERFTGFCRKEDILKTAAGLLGI